MSLQYWGLPTYPWVSSAEDTALDQPGAHTLAVVADLVHAVLLPLRRTPMCSALNPACSRGLCDKGASRLL